MLDTAKSPAWVEGVGNVDSVKRGRIWREIYVCWHKRDIKLLFTECNCVNHTEKKNWKKIYQNGNKSFILGDLITDTSPHHHLFFFYLYMFSKFPIMHIYFHYNLKNKHYRKVNLQVESRNMGFCDILSFFSLFCRSSSCQTRCKRKHFFSVEQETWSCHKTKST